MKRKISYRGMVEYRPPWDEGPWLLEAPFVIPKERTAVRIRGYNFVRHRVRETTKNGRPYYIVDLKSL